MRKIILLILFSAAINSAWAQSAENESPPKEEYKLNKTEFLEKHATDDTTTSLIHLFYTKRRNGIIRAAITLVPAIFGVAGVYLDVGMHPVILMGSVLLGSILIAPFGITGGNQAVNYSQKNLYLLIQDYKAGKPIPEKFHKKLKKYL